MLERFIEHLQLYLKRLDVVIKDANNKTYFDILNDNLDENGFKSYYTITWENAEHKFTATKRYTSEISIDYKKKELIQFGMLGTERELIEQNEDEDVSPYDFLFQTKTD